MKLILLGAPGSGKGTQAAFLCGKLHLPHISTGDIFRDNINRQTALGVRIKNIIDAGDFCPDDLTVEIVKDRLLSPDCKNGYLLDGFPRNIFQAKALDEFDKPDTVINFDVDIKVIHHRLTGRRLCRKCGNSYHIDNIGESKICPSCGGEIYVRADDNPVSVEERLAVYQEQTFPLKEYYEKQGKLLNVDGNRNRELILADILKGLGI